jgi:NAD(P)-dependent dehydrogenase (short-subunit alcohol dehydrogenase family)
MQLFDLTGKVALVTGGSRGIGLMMARGLLEAGATVVISSRDEAACRTAVSELSALGSISAIPANLATEAECLRLAEGIGDRLDVLVNNAGATWGAPFEDYPESAWDKLLALNLKAPFFLTRALVPVLAASGSAEDPSRVVNVGSIDGLHVPLAPTYAYSSTKAALHHLTRVLARELGPKHITVNAIAPGPFESKMMAATLEAFGEAIAAASPLGRIGQPDDMAGAIIYLASRAGSYVTGALLPVDGGIATTL